MANYFCTCRTNYFRVTDEEKYQELFSCLIGEDNVHDFTEEKDGVVWHGFGSYASIGFAPEEDEDGDWGLEQFFNQLQKIMPDDEAFILMESGYEKLRYVTGFATVVTKKDVRYIDISSAAVDAAKEMLGNAGFVTRCDY